MSAPLRVLLVEDSQSDARLVREELAEPAAPGEVAITHARSLEAAMGQLEREPADCVLLDLSLPDALGLEGLEALLAAHRDLPVVVLASSAHDGTALEAVRAGAQDFLVKGETPGRVLLHSIRHAIERKQSEQRRAAPVAGDALSEPAAPAPAEQIRVFLCDDAPALRDLLRAFLELGGDVTIAGEAGDGEGLTGAVRAAGADVVLLDLSMPRVDGLEALAELRAAEPHVGIVVLSGFEPHRMAAKALALGADRYLEKAVGMEEVRATVRAVAAARRGTRTLAEAVR